MKTLEITRATASLRSYAAHAKRGAVVITRRGKPVAALVSVEGIDLESLALSTNPQFLSLIERSRSRHQREGGISSEEMRERLGHRPRK